jgi:hypothetical protein
MLLNITKDFLAHSYYHVYTFFSSRRMLLKEAGSILISFSVTVLPYHDGIARPQVAGGGGGLQIWRVAASILNRQLRTAKMG